MNNLGKNVKKDPEDKNQDVYDLCAEKEMAKIQQKIQVKQDATKVSSKGILWEFPDESGASAGAGAT